MTTTLGRLVPKLEEECEEATKTRAKLVEREPRMSPGDAGCGCHPAPYIRKGFRSGAGLEEGRSSPVVPGQQAPGNVTQTAEVNDMAAVNESERYNRTLIDAVLCYVDKAQNCWYEHLTQIAGALRSG